MPQEILTTEFQDRSHQPLGHPSIPLVFIIVLYYLASNISRLCRFISGAVFLTAAFSSCFWLSFFPFTKCQKHHLTNPLNVDELP